MGFKELTLRQNEKLLMSGWPTNGKLLEAKAGNCF